MYIIMMAAKEKQPRPAERLDPDLRALLDHVAVELAEEYIRLMEAAGARAAVGASAVDD